jgi:hypothetical protein
MQTRVLFDVARIRVDIFMCAVGRFVCLFGSRAACMLVCPQRPILFAQVQRESL